MQSSRFKTFTHLEVSLFNITVQKFQHFRQSHFQSSTCALQVRKLRNCKRTHFRMFIIPNMKFRFTKMLIYILSNNSCILMQCIDSLTLFMNAFIYCCIRTFSSLQVYCKHSWFFSYFLQGTRTHRCGQASHFRHNSTLTQGRCFCK